MVRTLWVAVLLLAAVSARAEDMILVVGAGGTDEYSTLFGEWADQWKQVATLAGIDCHEISGRESHYDQLKSSIAAQTSTETSAAAEPSPLWLVLLGHGTFDRNTAKFNLRGKDVEAKELADWLKPCKRPLIVITAFSCSGAFLEPLQAPERVVITATKSGAELNFSRFGGYMAMALNDMSADLDHDDQVSLLEAFLLASNNLKQFYDSDARLMTEHALLEDNQDGKGVSAEFFVGIRATETTKDGSALDGRRAHRFIIKSSPVAVRLSGEKAAERDRIEADIEKLRATKAMMTEDEYYAALEKLLLPMARLYAEKRSDEDSQ